MVAAFDTAGFGVFADITCFCAFIDNAGFGVRTLLTSQVTLLVDALCLVAVLDAEVGPFTAYAFLSMDVIAGFRTSVELKDLVHVISGFVGARRELNCVSLVFKPCSSICPTISDAHIILGFSTGLTGLGFSTGLVFSGTLTGARTGCLDFSNK